MLGRIIALAAGVAVASVGVAGIASRTTSRAVPTESASQNKKMSVDSWAERGRAIAADTGSSSGGKGDVRLGRAGDSHFYADADVEGTSLRMMVDSGASIVALTRRDAEAIGIDVDRLPIAGNATTAGGVVPMRPVMLNSIDVDGVEVRHVQAAVIDADMPASLLGQSFLSKLTAVNIEGDTMTLR